MEKMNLHDWSILTIDQRKVWLQNQSPRSLTELLSMLGDMLEQADAMDAELATLGNISNDLANTRNFTYHTLRDVKQYVVAELRERQALIALTV